MCTFCIRDAVLASLSTLLQDILFVLVLFGRSRCQIDEVARDCVNQLFAVQLLIFSFGMYL